MSALRWAESILLQLPMRIALGGIFVYAAYTKISNIQAFAFSIKGFKILDPDTHANLIVSASYTMPWIEMIAGVLLIIGLCTRAAALTLALMLLIFIVALVYVIYSPSIDANCSCFGDKHLYCGSAVGWCQVIRDLILLVPAGYLLWRGGGILGLDPMNSGKIARQSPKADANTDWMVDETNGRA